MYWKTRCENLQVIENVGLGSASREYLSALSHLKLKFHGMIKDDVFSNSVCKVENQVVGAVDEKWQRCSSLWNSWVHFDATVCNVCQAAADDDDDPDPADR